MKQNISCCCVTYSRTPIIALKTDWIIGPEDKVLFLVLLIFAS